MSTSYYKSGRTAQKARTRAQLVAAARRLFALGITPTVEQAATEAAISRPTAYRYFSNQDALLAATNAEETRVSLLGRDSPTDPKERLDKVAKALTHMLLENEVALRAMLRVSLEPRPEGKELALRTGRRITWIRDALLSLRDKLPDPKFRKLVLGIGAALGIESLVWLVDVAGLSRIRAADHMRWSAGQILRSVLAEEEC